MLQSGHSLQNGRYLLTRFVRAGGAGVVWAAQDRRPRKGDTTEVAIKVLDAVAGGTDAAAREAEVAARVRHPSVVRVRDTFVEDGLACMVMDLARCSLADLVAREGPLPPPVALGCALQACAALAEAHRAGVVHRDVKPHNLLVFGDGSVRLGDFGAARALMDGHTRTRTGALLGSIPFMAPEQRRDPRAVRPSTDVYGLAVTLAWLLLGEAPDDPWTEEAAAQLRAAGTPDGLVRAVATGGARRAEERPQDAAAYLAILEACGVVAGPLAQNDVDETSVDRHGSGEMPALVRGVEQLGAGGSRPPQRPPVGGDEIGRRKGIRAAWAWGLGMASLAVGTRVACVGTHHAAETAPASNPSAEVDSLPPCEAIAEDYVTVRTNGPREVVAASFDDLDDDGFDDALFVSQLDEQVLVYRGGPNPKLESPVVIPIERAGVPVHAVDVDGDGQNDLVALHQDAAKWKAYGLDGNFRVTWTREWQEELGAATGWDVMAVTGGPTRLVYGSNNNGCLLERRLAGGNLSKPSCIWTSLGADVVDARTHEARVAIYLSDGLTKFLDLSNEAAFEPVRQVAGRHFAYPSRGIAWVRPVPSTSTALGVGKDGAPMCARAIPLEAARDVGDWNGDDAMDAVVVDTCSGCTSALTIRMSRRSAFESEARTPHPARDR